MDPALLASHAAFKKRAATTTLKDDTAKKTKMSEKDTLDAVAKAKARRDKNSYKMKEMEKSMKAQAKQQQALAAEAQAEFDYKNVKAAPSNDWTVLSKIVDFMKKRHLDGQTWMLSLDETVAQLEIYDLSKKTKEWLNDRLPHNSVLEFDEMNKFHYKPPFPIKNKTTLLSLLKKHDMENKGGILASEVAACVGNAEKIIEALGDQVIRLKVNNKKKDMVLFFNDPDTEVTIDEEFKQLWRTVNIAHVEERKIDEYLAKHGINTMKDLAPKQPMHQLKRRARKSRAQQVQNEHMAGTLQDYSVKD